MNMEHYDAFISYRRRSDLHTAELIRMKLEARGIHCFMDMHDIPTGDEWEQRLNENIQAAPNFICILTDNAMKQVIQLSQDQTKDWFRWEIEKALGYRNEGKKILSVLCNEYSFPNTWDEDMPYELRQLRDLQAIEFVDKAMDASIEHIIKDMITLSPTAQKTEYRLDGKGFVEDVLRSDWSVTNGCFMFHAGADWFKEVPRRDLLDKLIRSGVKIKVLLNTEAAAMTLAQHMTHPKLRYTPFEESISDWKSFRDENPDKVEVRISQIPILRRMYMFLGDDPKQAIMRVSYYTYNSSDVQKNCCQILSAEHDAEYFALYKNEFEYLWNNADTE